MMHPVVLRRTLILVLLCALLGAMIAWGPAMVPFAIGLLIAYLLDPVVLFLGRRLGLGRTPAVIVVLCVFLVVSAGIIAVAYPVLVDGVASLTQTVADNEKAILGFFDGFGEWLSTLNLPIDRAKLVSGIFGEVESFLRQFFGELSSTILGFVGSLPLLIIIPLIVFYLLKDKERIFAVLKRYTKDDNEARIRIVFDEVNARLGGYLKGQVLLSVVVAAITTIAMFILDVPYAILIGLANGVLNVIPYFGPVIGAIPALILELIGFTTTGHFLGVLGFFVVMNVLVSTILSPRIFASATNLHPLVVLFALFLGAQAMGMMGMVIAIPLAIVVQTLVRVIFDTYIKEI